MKRKNYKIYLSNLASILKRFLKYVLFPVKKKHKVLYRCDMQLDGDFLTLSLMIKNAERIDISWS